jgi:hypothetical protein
MIMNIPIFKSILAHYLFFAALLFFSNLSYPAQPPHPYSAAANRVKTKKMEKMEEVSGRIKWIQYGGPTSPTYATDLIECMDELARLEKENKHTLFIQFHRTPYNQHVFISDPGRSSRTPLQCAWAIACPALGDPTLKRSAVSVLFKERNKRLASQKTNFKAVLT